VYDTTYYWGLTACHQYSCSDISEIRNFYNKSSYYQKSNAVLSDGQFKTNETPLTAALDKVILLNGIYFNWNTAQYPELEDTSRQIGFIAQELQPVIPEVVSADKEGIMYIDYSRMVPVLSEAIKEMNSTIQQKDSIISNLDARLTALEDLVAQCCEGTKILFDNTMNVREVELSDIPAIVLDQNQPNPFAENTSISYFIPDNVISAQIIFTDNKGRILKIVEITDRGKGMLKVYAQDLSSGIYSYSLVADGKTIDTKKMVKSTK
jgi:hypothetical protein